MARSNASVATFIRALTASVSRVTNRSATPDCHTIVPARMAASTSSSLPPSLNRRRSAAQSA